MLLIYRVTEDDVSDELSRPLPRKDQIGWWAVERVGGTAVACGKHLDDTVRTFDTSYAWHIDEATKTAAGIWRSAHDLWFYEAED